MSKNIVTIGTRPELFKPLPAVVFACLIPGEMRVMLLSHVGHVDTGALLNVPIEIIPFELRVPNARLWVELDEN